MSHLRPTLFGRALQGMPSLVPKVTHEEIAKATEAFLAAGGHIERVRASGAWQCYPIELWTEDDEAKGSGRPLV